MVKTRLAATLGDESALDIYLQLIDLTVQKTQSKDWQSIMFLSTNTEDLPQYNLDKRLQVGGDLGNKLKLAFAEMLDEFEKCIIVGSDCPYLSTTLIEQSYEALDNYDLVLGPTPDGGYYLIGLKNNCDLLFENINWSTDSVLSETINAAHVANLSSILMPILSDVDHASDWEDYLASKPDTLSTYFNHK